MMSYSYVHYRLLKQNTCIRDLMREMQVVMCHVLKNLHRWVSG